MYIDIQQRRLYDMSIIGAARLNIMQYLQFVLLEIWARILSDGMYDSNIVFLDE